MSEQLPAKKLEVKQAEELAGFYRVPQSLVNMFFVEIGGAVFAKEPFLLYLGHKKGIQRITVTKPVEKDGAWECEARIYPEVSEKTLESLAKLTESERKAAWAYLTEPTVEWGTASEKNVRAAQLHQWIPQIAIKRAVCRALRLFSGYGGTSYEELAEADHDIEDLKKGEGYKVIDDKSQETLAGA